MTSINTKVLQAFARLIIGIFGVAAVGWTVFVLPRFWSQATISQAAARIIAGDVYTPDAMAALEQSLWPDRSLALRPAVLGPASIILLRQTEEAIARADLQPLNSRLTVLHDAVTHAILNAPEDSYEWLALFWLESYLYGFDAQQLRYLQMSYAIGPQEGWVAVKRNRIVLGLYATLTNDLKEAAVNEFVGLVRSQFYADAADIVSDSTPAVREALSARLAQLPNPDRQSFAKVLTDKGFFDMDVPGVNTARSRPWLR